MGVRAPLTIAISVVCEFIRQPDRRVRETTGQTFEFISANAVETKPPLRAAFMSMWNLLGLPETFVHFVPVDYVPPGFQIICPSVLVFQVISVLPDVVSQNRKVAIAHGIVLIGS